VNPIEITEPLYEICRRLDIEPRCVSELRITPTEAVAELYLTNENNAKYVADTGEPARTTLRFKVTT
jgi:hypothetical protein